MIIPLPLRMSWPRTHSSSEKALCIVLDKRIQSPEVTASRNSCIVGSFPDACSTVWSECCWCSSTS